MPVAKSALEIFAERLSSLSPLAEQDVRNILALAGPIGQARANIDVVTPGQQVDHVCLVVEGLLGRFGQLRDGKRQITAVHIPGDVADLHSVASPRAASAIQALTTTTIIRIPHAHLRKLASESIAITRGFWAYSAMDAALLSQWAVSLGRKSATSRLAHLLCELALRMEAAGRGDRHSFELDVTQAQFGDMLGLTSIHVNRTFRALRDANLVTTAGRHIAIRDWDQLAGAGDFDSDYLQLDGTASEGA
jgi:CRP-like cAMP-binding protein